MIPWIKTAKDFPPVEQALHEPNGLLCSGGTLAPPIILAAYTKGIFPWFSAGQPVLWWSPDPRMVLIPSHCRVTKSLAKTIRSDKFETRFDSAFTEVIRACAAPREAGGGTWIVEGIQSAYTALHLLGYAHSVETWRDGELVGGLYGIALGRVFFGESMFSRETDASKVALVALVEKLKADGFELIDCQQETRHLASMGAAPITRREFTAKLKDLINASTAPAPSTYWSATTHEQT